MATTDFSKYGWSDDLMRFVESGQREARARIAAFPDAFADPDGWKEPDETEG
jgi:hypothetical protein